MSINQTVPDIDFNLCTLELCPLEFAQVRYDPTLAGNALYLAIFALLLLMQTLLGIRYRTWGYFGAMLGGLILEIVGYGARVKMHFNPFLSDPFLMQVIFSMVCSASADCEIPAT